MRSHAAMSTTLPLREQTASSMPSAAASKNARVLACVLCQQRKVKCDRKFPCGHCIKAGVQCVPASLVPRQRRRRFPERELLDRLRHFEGLLRRHKIPFEPLHPSSAARDEPDDESRRSVSPVDGEAEAHSSATAAEPGGSATIKSEPAYDSIPICFTS